MNDFVRYMEILAGIAVSEVRLECLDQLDNQYQELYEEWRTFDSLCQNEEDKSKLYEAYYPEMARIAGQIRGGRCVFSKGVERVDYLVYGKNSHMSKEK